MKPLEGAVSDFVSIRGRFARSVSLDSDADHAERLDGYLPTGRSLEVVRRIVRAMSDPAGTRAFSITGPYGSGKSSLALFLDSLLGPTTESPFRSATSILREYDLETARQVNQARTAMQAGPSGFVRAVVTTPQREPITTTVIRALSRGADRAHVHSDLRSRIGKALDRAESGKFAPPTYREVRLLLEQLAERKPVLLVIDEFGKNLEAYADSGREGDLYLLQQLAEWATGSDPLPLVLITVQHMAFEAYASDATTTQRREWAKVQGRFEDIPFVDSAATSRGLISAAIEQSTDAGYVRVRDAAARALSARAEQAGVPAVADATLISSCYPLHPAALLVLPELCARYGQNERTLFSFLSSAEPRSVISFGRSTPLEDPPSWVHLDQIYDYFVESASTFVGASHDATRWIEVETTIRDAHGLSDLQIRVLKSVGLLNLISTGGSLRASPEMVAFAFSGDESGNAVEAVLRELEDAGLVTYRDFASEYRVWRGSDFDIAAALRSARRQVRQQSLAGLLETIHPMTPVVASRHSIRTGTTRAFARLYADRHTVIPSLDDRNDRSKASAFEHLHGSDGLLVYVVDPDGTVPSSIPPESGLPVVTVTPRDSDPLVEAAVEVGALIHIAKDVSLPADDRVARRELTERTAYARQVLDRCMAEAFSSDAKWTWTNPSDDGDLAQALIMPGGSRRYLSLIMDTVFSKAPAIPNETINRTELTSQGSRARRVLLEALLTPARRRLPRLGLTGDGPEVSMYRAVLEDSGIHRPKRADTDSVLAPSALGSVRAGWTPVWEALAEWLRSADDAPVSVTHLLNRLGEPPFGVKLGPAVILLAAAFIEHASEIAVYEHGTFRPRLDAPLIERLVRNPDNFGVKYLAAGEGSKRWEAVSAIGQELAECLPNVPAAVAATQRPTILTVTLALVEVLQRRADPYTHKTKAFWGLWNPNADRDQIGRARLVRDTLLSTHEPDVLLFESLPSVLGFGPLTASGRGLGAMKREQIADYARTVAEAVQVIDSAQSKLVEQVESTIRRASGCNTIEETISRASELVNMELLAADVRQFARVAGMRELYSDNLAWLSAVTETVCGNSLLQWTDQTALAHLERLRGVVDDTARVAELARFADGKFDDAFRAYQLQVTGQDGSTFDQIVTVPERAVEDIREAIDLVLASIATNTGLDRDGVRDALLALLASERVDSIGTPQWNSAGILLEEIATNE